MSIFVFAVAFIMLANPAINVFDILPDFIGWLMIMSILKKVKYLSVKMDSAATYSLKMVWLTLARFISIVLLPYIDGTMKLTVTLVFCVLELVWGIPAFRFLFDGISELSELYGGTLAYKPLWHSPKEGIQIARAMTVSFLIVKSIFNLLPEFLELSGQSSDFSSVGSISLIAYKPIVYIVSIVIASVVAIAWLCVIIPFSRRVLGEKGFIENIHEAYKIKITEMGIERGHFLTEALLCIAVSGLFMFCIMLDSMNIVPRFIFPAVLIYALIKIGKCGYNVKLPVIAAAICTFVSAVSYIVEWVFVIKFGYYSLTQSFAAYDYYITATYIISFEMILLTLMQILISRVMVQIVKCDTIPDRKYDDVASAMNANEIKRIKFRINVSSILYALSAVCTVAAFVFSYRFAQIWIILLAVNMIWFIYSYVLYSNIREKIEYKYLI